MLRVAPKAASNRYPYLFSSCGRAQISLPYIQMRQHIIQGKRRECYAQRPRRLRIGIPIYFLTAIELKYLCLIYRYVSISFREQRKPPKPPTPLCGAAKSFSERVSSFYYHIHKSISHFMYSFKSYLRLCIHYFC